MPRGCGNCRRLLPFVVRNSVEFFGLRAALGCRKSYFTSRRDNNACLETGPRILSSLGGLKFGAADFGGGRIVSCSCNNLVRDLGFIGRDKLMGTNIKEGVTRTTTPEFLSARGNHITLVSVGSAFRPTVVTKVRSIHVPNHPNVGNLQCGAMCAMPRTRFSALGGITGRDCVGTTHSMTVVRKCAGPNPRSRLMFKGRRFGLNRGARRRACYGRVSLTHMGATVSRTELRTSCIVVSLRTRRRDKLDGSSVTSFVRRFTRFYVSGNTSNVVNRNPRILHTVRICGRGPVFCSLKSFVLRLCSVRFIPRRRCTNCKLTSRDSGVCRFIRGHSRNFGGKLVRAPTTVRAIVPC